MSSNTSNTSSNSNSGNNMSCIDKYNSHSTSADASCYNQNRGRMKMRKCDFIQIVLISAATVLLTTTHSCCHAYMSHHHYHRSYCHYQLQEGTNSCYTKSTIRQQISSSSSSKRSSTSASTFALHARRRSSNSQESWSKSASASTSTDTSSPSNSSTNDEGRTESRLGVRRRVRSVLERAKKKTGIRNNSEDFLGSSSSGRRNSSSSSTDTSGSSSTSPLFVTAERRRSATVTATATRTTVSTSNKPLKTTSTVSNVVADAASIGGLGAVVVDNESGKIDVALDYVPPAKDDEEDKNEKSSGANESTVILNGETVFEDANGKSSSSSTKKSSPASTYSPSTIRTKPQAEDILVPAKPVQVSSETKISSDKGSSTSSSTSSSSKITELDALRGDVSAAFSMPPPPLPFTLPKLTPEQNKTLYMGERVQFQSDMGREGSGFIAVDVKAPAAVIWECLLDFYSYPETMPTIRDMQMFTNTHLAQDYYAETAVDREKYEDGTLATLKHGVPSVTRAAFTLSKFRLKIAAIHKYRTHPQGDYMIFTLDPACTNLVLQSAKGVWHTQSNPDGRGEEYTRVWLLCELKVSPLLPKWIVDYAAKKAMPRASSWIKPHCEAAAELWFKDLDE